MPNYGCYASLTDIRSALAYGATETADDTRLRQVLEAVSRFIDDHCGRHFYALTATYTFTAKCGSRLLLPKDLLSITTLKTDSDGDWDYDDTWALTDYHLRPANTWPKWEIVTKAGGAYSFPTQEEGVQIAGLWGHGDGDSASPWTASGLTATVATAGGTTLTLSATTGLAVCQTVLVESEQMYCTALGVNSATVIRGVNGTTAAAHAGAALSLARYPAVVTEAAIILAAQVFRVKDAPLGIAGSAEMGTSMVIPRMHPHARMLLMPYRRLEAV